MPGTELKRPDYARVTKTLRPQQAGTLKLTRRYGDALVCVRYREDGKGQRRCTTIELIIDEGPVQRRLTDRSMVWVRIPWRNLETRLRAKQLGARWDPDLRHWRMSLRVARMLGLEAHAKLNAAEKKGTHAQRS